MTHCRHAFPVRTLLVAAACAAAVGVSPPLRAAGRRVVAIHAAPVQAAAEQTNAQKFDAIWKTARDNFYDRRMHGLDWRAVGDRYRRQAEEAPDRLAFQAMVDRMLDELHASHTGYYTEDDMEYYLLRSLFERGAQQVKMEHIGVQGARENGHFVVHALFDGGPAARAGIRVSDRLLAVGGKPFTTVGSFRGHAGESVSLDLDRPGVGRMSTSVTPVSEQAQQAFLEATRRSERVLDYGGRRIGYMHLWTMADRSFREELDSVLLGRLADTDGLILDLRDGFGGTPEQFTDILYRPDVVFTTTDRSGRSFTRHSGYAKPLVVLIDEGTRSAKEWFSYEIKKTGRGALVGARTAGAFLGAGGFPIGSDGYLELPVVDLRLDGKWLEGNGVAPDVAVPTAAAYSRDDRQLARGLDVLMDRVRAAEHNVIVP